MKKLVLLIILSFVGVYSQVFREIYTSKIILNQNEDNNNNLFIIQVPTLSQSVTFTIPVGQGINGDVLTTNGINSTTWTGLTGGSVGGVGDGLVQFNDNGFGGSSSFIWNNTSGYLGVGLVSPSYTLHSSGTISVGSVANPAILAIGSANASGKYLYIKTSASSNSNVNFILPANNGTANQGLLSNSSGSLSWGGEIKKGPVSNNEPNDNDINNNADNAYIGGGSGNDINNNASNSTVFGGNDNDVNNNANSAIIVGGNNNSNNNNSHYSIITGGNNNNLNNNISSAGLGGGKDNDLNNNANYGFVGGGKENDFNNNSNSSVIFGGYEHDFNNDASYAVIGGGANNDLKGDYSAIFTGNDNEGNNNNNRSLIFSGKDNATSNSDIFLGSGNGNTVAQSYSFVLNGDNNDMTNNTDHSGVLWGTNTNFSGNGKYTFIGARESGISNNSDDCIMFGRRPQNWGKSGNFILGDSNDNDISTDGDNNEFRARFSGGYRLWSNSAMTVGVGLDAGASSWASVSDRNMKEVIVSLNPLEFIDKIKKLEIFSWSYKGFEETGIRNYGPMAQDFYALFGKDKYGTYGNNTSIKELDAAAILILGVQGSKIEVDSQSNELKNAISNSDKIDSKLRELEEKLNSLENKIK